MMYKFIVSVIKFTRSFRLSIYELVLVSVLSLLGNLLLLQKVGLIEFNRYALYLSYAIIINFLNLGLQLKIPKWLMHNGGEKKVLLAILIQIIFTTVGSLSLCLIRMVFPWVEIIPEFVVFLTVFVFVLSQQIDELFHTYCRIHYFEIHSFVFNLFSKMGILFIILFFNLGSAFSYFKMISLFVFTISLIKLITYIKLNSLNNYLVESVNSKKKLMVEIIFESKSTWLSNISNSLYNGIGRVYLASIGFTGILGLYTLISQVYVTIHALLSLHIMHLMKHISAKNAIRKLIHNGRILNFIAFWLFSVGFFYVFYMLRKSTEGSKEVVSLSFILVATVIMPIFSLQKFIILQLWGQLDKILFFNLKLALLCTFLLMLIFYYIKYKVFILVTMFFVGLISNLFINREFKKFKLNYENVM